MKENIDLFTGDRIPTQLAVSEPPYLKHVRVEFECFKEELKELASACSVDQGAKKKASKRRWLRAKGQRIRLRDRCVQLKGELESIYRLVVDQASW